MRAYPASSPSQKVAFLFAAFDHLSFDAVSALEGSSLGKDYVDAIFNEVARAAKEDGLYSKKTNVRDIAYNLQKVHFPNYLWRRKIEEAAACPAPRGDAVQKYTQRRKDAAIDASMLSANL